MPNLTVNGPELHYDKVGAGPQTIIFMHGVMLASESYEAQREAFSATHRVITFDPRGQERSEKTRSGVDLDTLAEDDAALIEQQVGGPSHVVGFSMGSFVAMRQAARHPALVRSLTLIGPSAAAEEPENLPRYPHLIRFVRWFGPTLLAPRLMKFLFGDTYLQSPAVAADRGRWLAYLKALPRSLHRVAAASAGRMAMTGELARIVAPTLVVSGEEDRPISPARAPAVHLPCTCRAPAVHLPCTCRAPAVHQAIPGSQFEASPRNGHAVMIERAETVNTRPKVFLNNVPAPA